MVLLYWLGDCYLLLLCSLLLCSCFWWIKGASSIWLVFPRHCYLDYRFWKSLYRRRIPPCATSFKLREKRPSIGFIDGLLGV